MSISVLILTLNEEINLPACLETVSWSDDIVVFDSYSTDRTVAIAQQAGAKVVQRRFDNWSAHQNWVVEHIQFKHPWVFYTDADERCDQELKNELQDIGVFGEAFSAFQIRRKDYFMGKWLKHAQLYPTWLTRVFRPEKIRYERLVNPVAIVEGKTGQLKGHIDHFPFSHGISHWFDRHNKYSSLEAKDFVNEITVKSDWKGILSNSATHRRKAIKHLAYKLPFRPILILGYLMFIRGAFLDGMPGIHYSFMRSIYEYIIDLKVTELNFHRKIVK